MPIIEVEVWCATCGDGLCNETSSNSRGLHVNVCPTCMDKKDCEIADLEQKIQDLEGTLESVQESLQDAYNQINQLTE